MQESHDYMLNWRKNKVEFIIDGQIIHKTSMSPGGSLGFVAWIDNQYALVTPQGRFGSGVVDVTGRQSLIIDNLTVE